MNKMNIRFAPHLVPFYWLFAGRRRQVVQWPVMERQIDRMKAEGFAVSGVVINGVSYIGKGRDKRPLSVNATVKSRLPVGKKDEYRVNFMPDAGTLLVAFRMAADEVGAPAAPDSIDNYFVVMVEQPRVGFAKLWSLQAPGGILDKSGKFDFTSMEKPRVGALREYREEANAGNFPRIDEAELKPLGAALHLHMANTDTLFPFYVVKDVDRATMDKIRAKVGGSFGTDPDEVTRPCVLPFTEALRRTRDDGDSTWGHVMLQRLKEDVLGL
jgi:8-oxo-dGTP pyrophosphatase MutT (NUDIX family)